MTKNEVKQAIQRGLGRGYLAVRNDPDRYRDLVLWACGRNLAFDTQCEGTRAWYDYQLILSAAGIIRIFQSCSLILPRTATGLRKLRSGRNTRNCLRRCTAFDGRAAECETRRNALRQSVLL